MSLINRRKSDNNALYIGNTIITALNGVLQVQDSANATPAEVGGGVDSSSIVNIIDSAYINARVTSSGGGTDSATVIAIVDEKLLLLEVSDIVGVDGNPGEVLQSDGYGNSSWVDMKLIARQKAYATSLIFG